MATGKIKTIRTSQQTGRQYGFIKPDDGSEDVYFQVAWVQNAPTGGVSEGLRVQYETRRTNRGLQTSRVSVISKANSEIANVPEQTRYRFLNPYNFVGPLPQPPKGSPLLGRCEPPPHDRYIGLTGRITCSLETVTPLFVADAERSWIETVHVPKSNRRGTEAKQHIHLPFYRVPNLDHPEATDTDVPAIPASSIRGMIRSVFESATNSCFSVFQGQRLSYRLPAARAAELVPGRIEKDENGQWVLRLLPGSEPLAIGSRPSHPYAASVLRYEPPIRGKPKHVEPIDLHGLEHEKSCWARIEQRGIFCSVLEVDKHPDGLSAPSGPNESIISGWLCINNQNIENKRKERVFFRTDDNVSCPDVVELLPEVCTAYEDLIEDYQERHRDDLRKWDKAEKEYDQVLGSGTSATPAMSRYVYDPQDLDLHEGTLVYAGLSQKRGEITVDYIAPAAIPRVAYDHKIADLLPYRDREEHDKRYHRACEDIDHLCPACRTFGWTYQASEGETLDLDKKVAYASRVRFSYAKLTDNSGGSLDEVTLAILSTPKPTTTRFYLRPRKGKPRDGLTDSQAGYDGPNRLRGRKFYRHQGKMWEREYKRHLNAGDKGKDDQNRTIHGLLQAGNRFEFTLDFENLAPIELGALLWTLELEEDGNQAYHRMGMAKPLGFGSVRVDVVDLQVLDISARYTSSEDDGWRSAMTKKETYKDSFREAMEEAYDVDRFSRLINIYDLMTLLSDPPDLPIHYPRTTPEPTAEGKNFEWFMGNSRGGRRNPGPRLVLPLAPYDNEGFPLLDKYGNEPS